MRSGLFEEYLQRGKWDYETESSGALLVHFKGEEIECEVVIQADDEGVSFGIAPYLSDMNPTCAHRLYSLLLLLNFRVNFVKFCIDEGNDVLLLLETVQSNLTPDEFENALEMICLAADRFFGILDSVAHDPDYQIPPQLDERK